MAKKSMTARVAPWLALVILSALFHVHASEETSFGGPRLVASDAGCPACATIRSGMDEPSAPETLPDQAPLARPVDPVCPTPHVSLQRPAVAVRGPPAQPAV